MTIRINNDFYNELGDRWWEDDSHAIAILRVESRLKVRYILEKIRSDRPDLPVHRILDIACGAGFLTLPLAEAGHQMVGVDLSDSSLAAARKRLKIGASAIFQTANATQLPFEAECFDTVMLMDCLEHFDSPELAVAEAARVLRKGGLMFFHTFNRTWMANILAVKSITLVTRGTPDHVHVYDMFIKPDELRSWAKAHQMVERDMIGIRPNFETWGFWKSLVSRRIQSGFEFKFCKSQSVGYMGYFQKRS
jgi:2-polyprenyl-6-hydroxyphenyl methylase/3-demethylubiquinone-9 3-methyltransferase